MVKAASRRHIAAALGQLAALDVKITDILFVILTLDGQLGDPTFINVITAVFRNVDTARTNKKFTTYMQKLR